MIHEILLFIKQTPKERPSHNQFGLSMAQGRRGVERLVKHLLALFPAFRNQNSGQIQHYGYIRTFRDHEWQTAHISFNMVIRGLQRVVRCIVFLVEKFYQPVRVY